MTEESRAATPRIDERDIRELLENVIGVSSSHTRARVERIADLAVSALSETATPYTPYKGALEAILKLHPNVDLPDGRDWTATDCFHMAQEIAKASLSILVKTEFAKVTKEKVDDLSRSAVDDLLSRLAKGPN